MIEDRDETELDELRSQIAELSVTVDDMEWESQFWRYGALIAFFIAGERIWDRFF